MPNPRFLQSYKPNTYHTNNITLKFPTPPQNISQRVIIIIRIHILSGSSPFTSFLLLISLNFHFQSHHIFISHLSLSLSSFICSLYTFFILFTHTPPFFGVLLVFPFLTEKQHKIQVPIFTIPKTWKNQSHISLRFYHLIKRLD